MRIEFSLFGIYRFLFQVIEVISLRNMFMLYSPYHGALPFLLKNNKQPASFERKRLFVMTLSRVRVNCF